MNKIGSFTIESLTIEGYNDKPKLCPECEEGLVKPTWNMNVGQCDKCGANVNWGRLLKKEEIKYPITFEEWLETEWGKKWRRNVEKELVYEYMKEWRLVGAFYSPNLKDLCELVLK